MKSRDNCALLRAVKKQKFVSFLNPSLITAKTWLKSVSKIQSVGQCLSRIKQPYLNYLYRFLLYFRNGRTRFFAGMPHIMEGYQRSMLTPEMYGNQIWPFTTSKLTFWAKKVHQGNNTELKLCRFKIWRTMGWEGIWDDQFELNSLWSRFRKWPNKIAFLQLHEYSFFKNSQMNLCTMSLSFM